jgi:tripartite ATP-independent transporter DctP family solute receptor
MFVKKMPKTLALFLPVMLLLAVSVGNVFAAKSTEKRFDLKFTGVNVPGDAHTEAMFKFAQEVEKLSKGSIKVKVYHSGVLYSADAEPEALLKGEIEMAYLAPAWISSKIPYFNMFTAGYFFQEYDHMTKAFNGELAHSKMYKDIEQQLGVVPLAAYYLGSRQINTRNKPINSPEDMKGLLLRMPNTPAWLFLGKALGANPTPMAFTEVYTGLSTGAIDGQDNPLPTVKNAKFYEVTKYIALTNHVIDSVWPMVNKKVWFQMSDNQKKAMYKAAELARQQCDQQNLKAEAELVKFFETKGLKVTKPDLKKFKKQVQDTYLKDPEMVKTWDMKLYNQIQALAN